MECVMESAARTRHGLNEQAASKSQDLLAESERYKVVFWGPRRRACEYKDLSRTSTDRKLHGPFTVAKG